MSITHVIGLGPNLRRFSDRSQGAAAVLTIEGDLVFAAPIPMIERSRYLRPDVHWVHKLLAGGLLEVNQWSPVVAFERHAQAPRGTERPFQAGRLDGLFEGLARGLALTSYEVAPEEWIASALGKGARTPLVAIPEALRHAAHAKWPAVAPRKDQQTGKRVPFEPGPKADECGGAAWIAERVRSHYLEVRV